MYSICDDRNIDLKFGNVETKTWFMQVRALANAVDRCVMEGSPNRPEEYENALMLSAMLVTMFPK